MVLGKGRNEAVLQSGRRGTGVGGRVGMRRDAVRKSGSGVASRCSAALRAEGLCEIEVVRLSSPPKHTRAERLRLPSRLWLMCMHTTELRVAGPLPPPGSLGLHFPPDVQAETTEEDSVLLMHTLLSSTKDPLAMDPPVANRPKKSKTKKAPIKAITKTVRAAPPVPSANVITTNKPKITFPALNLPIIPRINQASATTEAANTQASSFTAQPKKANKTKRVTAKAAQGSQFPTGSESVTTQIKLPLQALNVPVIPQTIQAPVATESANSQALLASIKPKKAPKAKKANNKAIASATEISLAPSTTYTATTQGQITSIRTKKASKAKKATVKRTNTDTELLEAPDATETATRQIEASAAAIWPKKIQGQEGCL
ncbi:hypothetical protein J1605_006962 [Eschrichtius robustus]|uniref:Trophinin n=1 Tax=Eschrichtius robustus TaxID=9764 RepID=A0AB34H0E2_ESCRO|nr:hypothetical protein J1605_008547 [Eschrichtius robustus]KAJ8785699.1 hypothetical protein J1605_006962 [Eschrichtius robustus]